MIDIVMDPQGGPNVNIAQLKKLASELALAAKNENEYEETLQKLRDQVLTAGEN